MVRKKSDVTRANPSGYVRVRPPLSVCTEEEFLNDLSRSLISKGYHKLVPAGGTQAFPARMVNGTKLDLFNLYKQKRTFSFWLNPPESPDIFRPDEPEKSDFLVVVRGGLGKGIGSNRVINWARDIFPHMKNHTEDHKMTSIGHDLINHYKTFLVEYELEHQEDVMCSSEEAMRAPKDTGKRVKVFPDVGHRITVYWPLDDDWYTGTILGYNKVMTECHIRYDDGDYETLNLYNETFKLAKDQDKGPAHGSPNRGPPKPADNSGKDKKPPPSGVKENAGDCNNKTRGEGSAGPAKADPPPGHKAGASAKSAQASASAGGSGGGGAKAGSSAAGGAAAGKAGAAEAGGIAKPLTKKKKKNSEKERRAIRDAIATLQELKAIRVEAAGGEPATPAGAAREPYSVAGVVCQCRPLAVGAGSGGPYKYIMDGGEPMRVPEWLEMHGMAEYSPLFELNEVDIDTLPHLTQEDLKDMPVHPVGVRRELLTLFLDELSMREAAEAEPPEEPPAPAPRPAKKPRTSSESAAGPCHVGTGVVGSVEEWLQRAGLGAFRAVFELNKVELHVLPLLTLEDLDELLPRRTRAEQHCLLELLKHVPQPLSP